MFSSGFPAEISCAFVAIRMYVPRPFPAHAPLFDFPNNIWARVNLFKLLTASFCHSYAFIVRPYIVVDSVKVI